MLVFASPSGFSWTDSLATSFVDGSCYVAVAMILSRPLQKVTEGLPHRCLLEKPNSIRASVASAADDDN